MTKRMIVLSGSGGSGKTTTLKYLAEKLMVYAGYELEDNVGPFEGSFSTTFDFTLAHGGHEDNKYVYSHSNGVKVGISTAGDTPDLIDEGCTYIREHQCDIYVIASKTYGKTVARIERIAKQENIVPLYLHNTWLDGKNTDRSVELKMKDIASQILSILNAMISDDLMCHAVNDFCSYIKPVAVQKTNIRNGVLLNDERICYNSIPDCPEKCILMDIMGIPREDISF